MPPKTKKPSADTGRRRPAGPLKTKRPATKGRDAELPEGSRHDVESVIASLKRLSSKATRDGMARYGLPSDNAFGVPVGAIQGLGRGLTREGGRDHDLAAALWASGWYEARMLAAFVDDPALVTVRQMDRWAKDFDNWGICDTVCFHLFDRTPHAMGRVVAWAPRREEFVKRAAFALLACVALHDREDKGRDDERFARCLPLIQEAAADDRNFVKKGASWALRAIGNRSPGLRASCVETAHRMAASPNAPVRWVGRDALRDLTRPPKRRASEK
jgi:3-methyladenine DNA glycosylase AlkD